MNSKKVLLLVLALVLAIGMLTACASSSNTQVNTVGTSPNGSEIACC